MEPRASHLHTFFRFPFSIDKAAVLEDHKEIWPKGRVWFEELDRWVETIGTGGDSSVPETLGPWKRNAYTCFDLGSEAYDNMAAFHPFVRRVFFDVQDAACAGEEQESLLNTYIMPVPAEHRLFLEAEDIRGRKARVEITGLRLFLFTNGIGILSIGVEGRDLPVSEALWINKMMRKVFPGNQRQVIEGRGPQRLAIILERGGGAGRRTFRARRVKSLPASPREHDPAAAVLCRLREAGVSPGPRRTHAGVFLYGRERTP